MGEYNLTKQCHVSAPKYFKPAKSESTKRLKTEKSSKENLTKTLIEGTFEWMAAQKKTKTKNFFGKSKRFEGPSKF